MTALRPFYFMVVVWGDTFCRYFTDYCVASLLAPNNIPALSHNHHNKFLVCTTREDRVALQAHPIMKKLASYLEVVFIEIPWPAPGVNPCQHMGVGHKLATERCFQDRAYGLGLTPDLLVSDGTLLHVQRLALEGKQLVYTAGVRFAEEPFFQGLQDAEIKPMEATPSDKPLVASGRELVKIGLQAFHSQVMAMDFDAPYFSSASPNVFWRVPNEQGVIFHCLGWCLLLLDYGAIETHHTETFDTWTMDGDYAYQNLGVTDKAYICDDSDEVMLISWAPLDYSPVALKPGLIRQLNQSLCRAMNGYLLRFILKKPIFDPLKLALFSTPIRWHVNEFNNDWVATEKRSQAVVSAPFTWRDTLFRRLYYSWDFTKRLCLFSRVILNALKGDEESKQRVMNRLRFSRT